MLPTVQTAAHADDNPTGPLAPPVPVPDPGAGDIAGGCGGVGAARHTRGPWYATGREIWSDHIIVARACNSADDVVDPTTARPAAQLFADAKLIAAAPKLLDLAQLFARSVEYEIARSRNEGDEEGARMKTITLNLIRAATTEATGEA